MNRAPASWTAVMLRCFRMDPDQRKVPEHSLPYPQLPDGALMESQRDFGAKPRVASRELPWGNEPSIPQPQRGCDVVERRTQPRWGWNPSRNPTQGSLADSATLGWRTQSLWDWPKLGAKLWVRQREHWRRPKPRGRTRAGGRADVRYPPEKIP